jgi:hypothetical protein
VNYDLKGAGDRSSSGALRCIGFDCTYAGAHYDGAKLGKGDVNYYIWISVQHSDVSILKMEVPI